MAKKEEVSKLLSNMKASATPKIRPAAINKDLQYVDYLKRKVDLSGYAQHQAWPGRVYILVGNSYNAEHKKSDAAFSKKRAQAISQLFAEHSPGGSTKQHCVTLKKALAYQPFVKTLSRFELDWLRREAPQSLIGQAYDNGKQVNASFAVWRVDYTQVAQQQKAPSNKAAQPKGSRQLVGSK